MAKLRITLRADGYGERVQEWEVADDLVRPYAIFYDGWISRGNQVVSGQIYNKVGQGAEDTEADLGPTIVEAVNE